jgi:hypothetical protein
MQTNIALSTTESEYSALLEAARGFLWLMGLMEEVRERMVAATITIPTIRSTIFEDNEGAKAMATIPKMRPRKNHINGRMHHFRGAVSAGKLRIESIDTSDQLADIGRNQYSMAASSSPTTFHRPLLTALPNSETIL